MFSALHRFKKPGKSCGKKGVCGVMYHGTINRWFPLVRPATKALFLGGVALGGYP